MKCQTLLSGKDKKNVVSLLSTDLVQREVWLNKNLKLADGIPIFVFYFFPNRAWHIYLTV